MGLGQFVALAVSPACDSGTVPLGHERANGDEYLPWYPGSAYYARWGNPPVDGPNTWMLSVWMQNPVNSQRFQQVHMNLFTGLWQGITQAQLDDLSRTGMTAIGEQAGVWKDQGREGTIRGWLLGDQPDGAQLSEDGSSHPCIAPNQVIAQYGAMVANDPTRPVMLQLSRGLVEPDWVGRGSDCVNHPEHYPEYVKGGDIIAVVLYPIHAGLPLETVALAVERGRAVTHDEKPVIALIQASRINDTGRPTPAQIKAQVWMGIVHRAAGIEYFCHQIEPTLEETDCLDDAPTAAALEEINRQITELAPVLDTRPVANGVKVAANGVDTLLKRYQDKTYLFAVEMRGTPSRASFTLRDFPPGATAEVLGEGRSIPVLNGEFADDFTGYGVHLYRIDAIP